MAGRVDYKQKYEELKSIFMSSIDSAWRDGYAHGAQDAQTEQATQQQQQNDAMAQTQAGQPQSGEEAAPAENQEAPAPTSQNPNGDELDQHIQKLEGMLGKAEISPMELGDLKKTLSDIRSLQVQISLSKSMEGIKNTKLAKSQPISFSPKTKANLPEVAKNSLTLQQKIVDDVFSKWAKDEAKASSDISSILNTEGIVKKD